MCVLGSEFSPLCLHGKDFTTGAITTNEDRIFTHGRNRNLNTGLFSKREEETIFILRNMRVWVLWLHVCMSLHHVHAWYPWRPGQGIRLLGTGFKQYRAARWMLGTVFSAAETPLQPPKVNYFCILFPSCTAQKPQTNQPTKPKKQNPIKYTRNQYQNIY